MSKFINAALRPDVYHTAFKVSLVVGTILALINYSPEIFNGSLSNQNILQIILTYLVPYGVSTYSSVEFILNDENGCSNSNTFWFVPFLSGFFRMNRDVIFLNRSSF